MAEFSPSPIPPPHRLDPSIKTQRIGAQELALEISIAQDAAQESFLDWVDEGAFSIGTLRNFRSLEEKTRKTVKEERSEKAEEQEEARTAEVEKIDQIADQYAKKNPELPRRNLVALRNQLKSSDSKEEILEKVLDSYPDPSLADEVLDYLIETSTGELQEKLRKAKEDLNARLGREIKAGRNIATQSREFAEKGLGTATALRDLYRAITGDPRDANTLFTELSSRFQYEKMKIVIDFILHSLGQDLKSKGPSNDRGELHRLVSEGRSMQAILGVFAFFKSRMSLITQTFQRQTIELPPKMSFEQLSKMFMTLLQERYPSPDKVLNLASSLGIPKDLTAQVIIYTQMRDALRQTAPKLFRSEQHRQDILKSLIEAIERLDEQLEEEDDDEKENKENS